MPSSTELTLLTATEMAALVRTRKVSPVELVAASLARIEELNPRLNAFASIDAARARETARAHEQAVVSGGALGALHGVPITIKSSIDVAGLVTSTGSRLRATQVAGVDAPLVQRLKAAGAIVLGNTSAAEMLMAYETDNLLQGRVNNPWAPERTAGGSSGGEAAAIAAGLSAAGVGSDGGGSIRVPAHFTGICGLKPTPGRVPGTGHFPPPVGPFALIGVVGPMARAVADLQLMLEVMAGPDDGDSMSAPAPLARVSQSEFKALRVSWFEDDGRTPVTPETRSAVRAAATALHDAGLDVYQSMPEGLDRARELWWVFFGLAGGFVLGPALSGHESELSPILKEFTSMVASEPALTTERLMSAWMARDELRASFLKYMRDFPILLCPVCSTPAFRHGEREWTVAGRTARYLRDPDVFTYSQVFNLLGNPAAVVPVGRSPEGLPIGVQVVGRPFEEQQVLAVAAEIEQRCGGWRAP